MKQIATKAGVLTFFVLAAVGMACGVEPLACGLRGIAGGVAVYFIAKLCGRGVIRMIVNAAVAAAVEQSEMDS